jgi:probable F420-dependent oxidoreductase
LLRDITVPGDVWETTTHDRRDERDPMAKAQALLAEPRMAEECGLDSFSAGDHMYDTPDPLIDCMAAAAATTRLKVSQTVLANDFRHPAQVAKQIASIDVFSGGRAQLGIGAGYNESEYRQQGLELDPPKVRVARLRESVQIIKALLTSEEPVTFRGEYYTIDALMGLPRPVQKPNPPICIGGGGKAMLKMAAEFADVVDIMTKDPYPSGLTRDPRQFTRESVLEKIDWVKQCAGERFAGLVLGLVLFRFYRTDDREQAAREVHAEMDAAYQMHGDDNGFTLTYDEVLDSPYFAIGSDDEIVEHFVQLRRELGLTNFLVFKGYLDELKPILGRLRAAGD